MSIEKYAYASEQVRKIDDLLKQLSEAGLKIDPNFIKNLNINPELSLQMADELSKSADQILQISQKVAMQIKQNAEYLKIQLRKNMQLQTETQQTVNTMAFNLSKTIKNAQMEQSLMDVPFEQELNSPGDELTGGLGESTVETGEINGFNSIKSLKFNSRDDFRNSYLDQIFLSPENYDRIRQELLDAVDPQKQTLVDSTLQTYYEADWDSSGDPETAKDDFVDPIWESIMPEHKSETVKGDVLTSPENENIVAFVNDTNDTIKKMAETSTNGKSFNLSKFAQAKSAADNVIMWGPDSLRIDPFLRQPVSDWSIVERNKGFGLVVDDVWNIDWESMWRNTIMDKFSRSYRDKNGNWVGGYLQKRFEVDKWIPETNNYQLKPGELRKPRPPELGVIEGRLEAMRDKEADKRGYGPVSTGKPYNWKLAQTKKKIKVADLNFPTDPVNIQKNRANIVNSVLSHWAQTLLNENKKEVLSNTIDLKTIAKEILDSGEITAFDIIDVFSDVFVEDYQDIKDENIREEIMREEAVHLVEKQLDNLLDQLLSTTQEQSILSSELPLSTNKLTNAQGVLKIKPDKPRVPRGFKNTGINDGAPIGTSAEMSESCRCKMCGSQVNCNQMTCHSCGSYLTNMDRDNKRAPDKPGKQVNPNSLNTPVFITPGQALASSKNYFILTSRKKNLNPNKQYVGEEFKMMSDPFDASIKHDDINDIEQACKDLAIDDE